MGVVSNREGLGVVVVSGSGARDQALAGLVLWAPDTEAG
jgi:hypothetical protein